MRPLGKLFAIVIITSIAMLDAPPTLQAFDCSECPDPAATSCKDVAPECNETEPEDCSEWPEVPVECQACEYVVKCYDTCDLDMTRVSCELAPPA